MNGLALYCVVAMIAQYCSHSGVPFDKTAYLESKPAYAQYRNDASSLQRAYAEIASTSGTRHPRAVALRHRLDSMQAELRAMEDAVDERTARQGAETGARIEPTVPMPTTSGPTAIRETTMRPNFAIKV